MGSRHAGGHVKKKEAGAIRVGLLIWAEEI